MVASVSYLSSESNPFVSVIGKEKGPRNRLAAYREPSLVSLITDRVWRSQRDSNPQPSGPKPDALSIEL